MHPLLISDTMFNPYRMTNVMLNPDAIYFHDKDGTLPVAERYGSRIIRENMLNL